MLLAMFLAHFDEMRRIAEENPDDLAEAETRPPRRPSLCPRSRHGGPAPLTTGS